VFARDRRTGALAQLDGQAGCVALGAAEGCADGRALNAPDRAAVSPDGKSVYVASFHSGAVAVFARDRRTGALNQLEGEAGCVALGGVEGCADGRALDNANSVAVSPDGKSVYVTGANSVAVFARDRRTGGLTQLDGEDGCVAVGGAEGCSDGRALDGPAEVAVSADGKSVYVTSQLQIGKVAVFARDRRTGALTQLDGEGGCVALDGAEGCADARALASPLGVAVSQDGKSVYAASFHSGAVAVFARDRRSHRFPRWKGISRLAR
jgi:DNA-binding beta-propeller fold protein YncE